jgi:hypothetical protein
MTKHWSRPVWVCRLTNAQLLDEFGTADDARQHRGDAPDLIRRMDVLADEICRRERAGTFTEDDWKDAREGFQAVTDLIICRDWHVIRIEPVGNLTAIPTVTRLRKPRIHGVARGGGRVAGSGARTRASAP